MANQHHEKVFNFIEDFRKSHPGFYYLIRERNNDNKLFKGLWFPGTETSAVVGLFDSSGGNNRTPAISIVINENVVYAEIAFKNIQNAQELDIYVEVLNNFPEFKETSKQQFRRFFTTKDRLEEVSLFLEHFVPIVTDIIKRHKLDKMIITKEKFEKKYYKMMQYRFDSQEADQTLDYNFKITETNYIMSTPLNQILFGPPGTGKTYNTINKALEILEVNVDYKDRLKVKQLYDEKVKDGQIMFTTFHQSMSYEDFIEGIKPIKPEEEDTYLSYDVKDGIFKSMCKKAYIEYLNFYSKEIDTNSFYKFEFGWQALIDYCYSYLSSEEEATKLKTLTGKTFDIIAVTDRGNIVLKPNTENDREYIVSHDRTKKLFNAIPDLNKVTNIDKEFRSVIGGSNSSAYWSVLDFIHNHFRESDYQKVNIGNINNTDVIFENDVVKKNIDKNVRPFVLIIDEINRGNVSQIFGELITLIEEDKRLGKEEALEVTLPYSKEKFGVPPNLYIIGTMNTADRSVEALDAALRRRFSFVEMPPISTLIKEEGQLKDNDGVIDDIDLAYLLDTINNRIEMLLDKDHKIGHSYFMNVTRLDELKLAFQNKIIPLLQEYFFGDYGKIGLVLGRGFIQETKNDQNIFADFEYDVVSDYAEKTIYTINDFSSPGNPDFLTAINTLLKK